MKDWLIALSNFFVVFLLKSISRILILNFDQRQTRTSKFNLLSQKANFKVGQRLAFPFVTMDNNNDYINENNCFDIKFNEIDSRTEICHF